MKDTIFKIVFAATFVALANTTFAQQASAEQPLSLKSCIEFALENNTDIRKQNLAILQSRQRVEETRAAGLPQVNGSLQFADNLILAKQLLPGEIFGQAGTFIPVKFGVQYAAPMKVEASQLIFSKQYAAGLESAKAAEQLTNANAAQIRENVAYNVASAYFSAILTREQRKIAEANLDKSNQSVQVAQVQFDNKMIRRIDLDQLRVGQANTQSEVENNRVGYAQALDYLKIIMGYPLADTLVLGTLDAAVPVILPENTTGSNPVLHTLDQQLALKTFEIKGIRAQYMPTVGLFANYGYQAQFNKPSEVNWIPSAVVGLSVNVPIFDGFKKRSQLAQRNIDLQSIALDRQLAQNQLDMQYQNAIRKYNQSQQTARNLHANLDLAQNVYAAVQTNYKNGIATLSDLINAETGLRGAQTQHLTAQLQTRVAALDVLRANGAVVADLTKNN